MNSRDRLPGVVRLLYTQNPFYVISACLIMYGFYIAFRAEPADGRGPWLLAASLGGYTALMAATAVLLIRFGKVWEDARSIVIIVLLQIIAISMSFDEICGTTTVTAVAIMSLGLGFSMMVSELLMAGLRIRVPVEFRLPYHLLLALFYLYPLWVSPSVTLAEPEVITWRLYFFPVVAAAIALSLLPAVRRGSAFVAKNGTPWHWPWYPWTAFILLGLGIGVRVYVLAHSFSVFGWHNAFGAYYLAPIGFAVFVLMLEIGIVERRPRLQRGVLLAAPALLLMSMPWQSNPIHDQFMRMFVAQIGSPLWVTTVALLGLYTVAWLRRLPWSEFGFSAMLLAACFVQRDATDWVPINRLAIWPLVAIGLVQLVLFARSRQSWRCLVSVTLFVIAAAVNWRGTPFTDHGGLIPMHVVLATILTLAATGRDRFARWLNRASPALVITAAAIAILWLDTAGLMAVAVWCYTVAMAAIACIYWRLLTDRWWFVAAMINTAIASGSLTWLGYTQLDRTVGSQATTAISLGCAFFLLAALISAVKAGLVGRLRRRLAWLGVLRRTSVPES